MDAVKSTLSTGVALSGEQISSQPIEEMIELEWQQHESYGEQENEKNDEQETLVSGEVYRRSFPQENPAMLTLPGRAFPLASPGGPQGVDRKGVTDLPPTAGTERRSADIPQPQRVEHPQSEIVRKTLSSVAPLSPVMTRETRGERMAVAPLSPPLSGQESISPFQENISPLKVKASQKITADLPLSARPNEARKDLTSLPQQHDRLIAMRPDAEQHLPGGEVPLTPTIPPSVTASTALATPHMVQQSVPPTYQSLPLIQRGFSLDWQNKAPLPTSVPSIFMEATTYRFQRWGHDHSVNIQYQTTAQGAVLTLHPSDNLVQQRLAADWQSGNPLRWHLDQDEQRQSGSPHYPEDDEEQE